MNNITGLSNIGNTCWFNSIIQNLAFTQPVHNFLFSHIYREDANPNKEDFLLLESFFQLLIRLHSNSDNINELRSFKNIINIHDDRYILPNQHDSHEFLLFLIEKLHKSVSYEAQIQINGNIQNSLDRKQVKSIISWGKFFKDEYSYILDIIYGQYNSYLKCLKCDKITNQYEPFSDIQLSITNNTHNLYECLDELTSSEIIDNNNEWKCDKCNEFSNPKKKINIWKIPEILIISLKRFDNLSNKNNKIIDFPLYNLDLFNYVNGYEQNEAIYNLYSINNHSGNGINSGHYYSYCKHPGDNNWYEFNDDNVSKIDESNLITNSAYILFYKKLS